MIRCSRNSNLEVVCTAFSSHQQNRSSSSLKCAGISGCLNIKEGHCKMAALMSADEIEY